MAVGGRWFRPQDGGRFRAGARFGVEGSARRVRVLRTWRRKGKSVGPRGVAGSRLGPRSRPRGGGSSPERVSLTAGHLFFLPSRRVRGNTRPRRMSVSGPSPLLFRDSTSCGGAAPPGSPRNFPFLAAVDVRSLHTPRPQSSPFSRGRSVGQSPEAPSGCRPRVPNTRTHTQRPRDHLEWGWGPPDRDHSGMVWVARPLGNLEHRERLVHVFHSSAPAPSLIGRSKCNMRRRKPSLE